MDSATIGFAPGNGSKKSALVKGSTPQEELKVGFPWLRLMLNCLLAIGSGYGTFYLIEQDKIAD